MIETTGDYRLRSQGVKMTGRTQLSIIPAIVPPPEVLNAADRRAKIQSMKTDADRYQPIWLPHLRPDRADRLLEYCKGLDWAQNTINMRGKPIQLPRLEYIEGVAGAFYRYGNVELKANPWSEELEGLALSLELAAGLPPHYFGMAIGNFYQDGNQHIGWHADDAKEIGCDPAIVSISLGAARKFQARIGNDGPIHDYNLDHGAVLLMPEGMQATWKHRLPKAPKVLESRINLTFRPFRPF